MRVVLELPGAWLNHRGHLMFSLVISRPSPAVAQLSRISNTFDEIYVTRGQWGSSGDSIPPVTAAVVFPPNTGSTISTTPPAEGSNIKNSVEYRPWTSELITNWVTDGRIDASAVECAPMYQTGLGFLDSVSTEPVEFNSQQTTHIASFTEGLNVLQ